MKLLSRLLAGTAIILIVGGLVSAAGQGRIGDDTASVVALTIVTAAVSALVGSMHRHDEHTRAVLVQLAGLAAGVGILRELDLGSAIGAVTTTMWLAGVTLPVLLITSTPVRTSFRVRTPLLLLSGATVLTSVVIGVHQSFTSTGRTIDGRLFPVPVHAAAIISGYVLLVWTMLAFVCVHIIRSWRALTDADAPYVRPVLVAGSIWMATAAVATSVLLLSSRTLLQESGELRDWTAVAVDKVPLLSVIVLFGAIAFVNIIRPRLERIPTGALIDEQHLLPDVRDILERWTGDPTVTITYPETSDAEWNRHSDRVRATQPGAGRANTLVTDHGTELARIEHDPALLGSPSVLRLAAHVAASAARVERLTLLAETRVANARRMTARLVGADTTARTQLEEDLRRGPCHTLDRCAAQIRQGDGLEAVSEELKAAAAELRTISHGLYPAELLDGGLHAALPHTAGAPAVRLPRAVEVTAFLAVRDDPHATIELALSTLIITLSDDLADTNLGDRITVLDGTIDGRTITLPTGGS